MSGKQSPLLMAAQRGWMSRHLWIFLPIRSIRILRWTRLEFRRAPSVYSDGICCKKQQLSQVLITVTLCFSVNTRTPPPPPRLSPALPVSPRLYISLIIVIPHVEMVVSTPPTVSVTALCKAVNLAQQLRVLPQCVHNFGFTETM